MDITEMERFADDCFRDAPPPCSCVCPFGLDVRKLMEKIRRGSYSAAYRQYRESVIFPDIVSQICPAPCTEACVRARLDRGVALRSLEAACVSGANSTHPTRYSIMPKDQHIAVVGAGLAGLACTLRRTSYPPSNMERGRLFRLEIS